MLNTVNGHDTLKAMLHQIKIKLGDLGNEIFYLKQQGSGTPPKPSQKLRSPSKSPQQAEKSEARDELAAIAALLTTMGGELRDLVAAVKGPAITKEEMKAAIKEETDVLRARTGDILQEIEEIKDISYAGVPAVPAQLAIGAEIAATDAASTLRDIITPLREDVAGMADQSKAITKSLTWINTALKNKNSPPDRSKSYAMMAARPKHAIIVTPADPAVTGEKVIERIRTSLDLKETGIQMTRVRKAKNRKFVISFEDERNAVSAKKKLQNVSDIQNKTLFHGLQQDNIHMKVKYRKRARNNLQCQTVLEVSPEIHTDMLDAEFIHIGMGRSSVQDQSPLVQCARCLGFGHTKNLCQEKQQKMQLLRRGPDLAGLHIQKGKPPPILQKLHHQIKRRHTTSKSARRLLGTKGP
ncbi:hypothetical protein ACJJTC_012278 [Scirpophaga incertulas]